MDQEQAQVQQYAKQYNVDLDNQNQLTNQKIMQNNNIKLNQNKPVMFNSLNLIQKKDKTSQLGGIFDKNNRHNQNIGGMNAGHAKLNSSVSIHGKSMAGKNMLESQ